MSDRVLVELIEQTLPDGSLANILMIVGLQPGGPPPPLVIGVQYELVPVGDLQEVPAWVPSEDPNALRRGGRALNDRLEEYDGIDSVEDCTAWIHETVAGILRAAESAPGTLNAGTDQEKP